MATTTSTADHSELLTVGEVASLLRISEHTVRRLLATGELPGVRVGRQWRIAAGELDARLLPHPECRGRALALARIERKRHGLHRP
jgi:excisionase family DNA binding protein